ncbi:MAG: Lrp/AsnC family transcriptional regulator [Clostridia bacterium]|nr:Lrp/AsnC family transcriptional regulator [Clostridia bacterium]MBQ7289170.1 Lrp/AsnC family transcriptional regulator [Clostridia bacterium]
MNIELLKRLSENARYAVHDLAVMCNLTEDEVRAQTKEMEESGLIRGYKTVIDWDKLDSAKVSAIIELKVIPDADDGFEKIADRLLQFEEIESVYLMSGAYDFNVVVKAKTFQEVCMFVSKCLAPMKEVTSTTTHFVLRRYKDFDINLCDLSDDRGKISL